MADTKTGRLLFVGTGGGNDIFSTLLAAACLWHEGRRWQSCDIAGVISPFHGHAVYETEFPGVFETKPDSSRFLLRQGDNRSIGFIDAHVAALVAAQHPMLSQRVLALSLENGTFGLTANFAALAEAYEFIVLVDVGGDIFYSGPADSHVLSPMFDAMTLRAFVDSGAKGVLFEAGPGTDGEIEPESLTKAIDEAGGFDLATDIHPNVIDSWAERYRKWIEPHRTGNTVPTTIQAFRSTEIILHRRFRARAHLGGLRKYAEFDQRIHAALCRKFYLVKPERIVNPFAVSCASPVDWFHKTQVCQHRTNNEANLEYIWVGGKLWQFLTPSPLLSAKDRDELLELGLYELASGVCDGAWLFARDWEELSNYWAPKFQVQEGGPLVRLRRP